MPEIPTAVHVLQALVPLWTPLYTALEWATQQTRAYFETEVSPSTGISPRVSSATRPNGT
jgi:hypothetical protein